MTNEPRWRAESFSTYGFGSASGTPSFRASAIALAAAPQHLRQQPGHRLPDAGLVPPAVAAIHAVPLPAAARHLPPPPAIAGVPHDSLYREPSAPGRAACPAARGRHEG